MDDVLVLAVVGMPATGKSEVIKKLKEDFNFFHLYYGDITFDEIKRRGLELNEANERLVREEFRVTGDLGIYSRFILPKIQEAIKNGHDRILLESMYNVYEYEIIKEAFLNDFKVLAIHSDSEIRLDRIGSRTDRRLTKKELDSRQMSEAKKLGKGAVIALADFHYVNNGKDMSVFEKDLDLILRRNFNLVNSESNHVKDFNSWNEIKKSVELRKPGMYKTGQIVWCRLGENVGTEELGKGNLFKRPVLIIKKFSRESYFVVPLTTKEKKGDWYFRLPKNRWAILNQAKLIDSKRFDHLDSEIPESVLQKVKQSFIKLINS